MKSKHIGIAACSANGAALCYQTIVSEGLKRLGNHQHPEVTMHTPSLSDYMDLLADGQEDWVEAARVVVKSAQSLQAAGADFVICPDNTIHEGIDRVLEEFPLPFIHIADVVAKTAADLGMKKLLIMGTRYTARSSYYQTATQKYNIECVMPSAQEIDEIDRVIWEELYWAELKPASLEYYQSICERYKSEDCDGVVLGCTEIPLLLNEENSPLAVLDSTRLLANAALDFALSS
jgi:aspartate racemase